MDIGEFSFVVTGSGLLGSVIAERIACHLDQKVLVLEKRNHTGGNCHSETDPVTGIEYHSYGTHVFHTSNETVWNCLNLFTSFTGYRHRVLSSYKNRNYKFPINLETINNFYNVNLRPCEVDDFMARIRDDSLKTHKTLYVLDFSDTTNFRNPRRYVYWRDFLQKNYLPVTQKGIDSAHEILWKLK